MKPATRRLAPYLVPFGLGLAALLMIYGRFVFHARDAVREAATARAAGDLVTATRSYRDALRAFVPGSPFEERALAGLTEIAASARASGDRDAEHRAWEAMRLGLLGTRSLFMPHPARYREATQRLAELDERAQFPSAGAADLATVSIRGNGPGRSVRPLGPAVASTLIGLFGFALWIAATVLMIRRALERESRNRRTATGVPPILLPGLFLVGFALFLAGLRFS